MIDKHTIATLEFPKIINLITGRAYTPYGKEEIARLAPLFDKEEIDRRQLEISQMKDIIDFGHAFPLYSLDDCREQIKQTTVEGHFLEPKEIKRISELVAVSIEIHNYDKEGREKFPAIVEYITKIRAFPELRKEIDRTFDEQDNIKDNASPQLKKIRLQLNDTRNRITTLLGKVLASQHKQAGWQDDVITIRNGRYVIPVPSSQYKNDLGILHDRSQSGATLFVEPGTSVELNNRINILQQEERLELDRILRALTREIGQRAEPLLENTRLIGKLDAIYACAQFSRMIHGNRPVIIDEPSFDLKNSRHPLLIVQFKDFVQVVPNDINLNQTHQVVLVTGPNTGGKTILLKTIGLSVLMAQAGLHIAADEKSEIGIFKNVFADIGDEQSIELSLSTFSSHIRNIINGLNNADNDVLLLFDEIGAGTDPREGSALAEAIIHHVIQNKTRLVATTHYSHLKTLAMDFPEIENASLDFDLETLAPTYHLNLGIPGSSFAVEIASRLGMPDSICKKASSLIGTDEKSLSVLISSLEAELAKVKDDRTKLTEKLTRVEELERLYRIKSETLYEDIEKEKKEMLAETEKFMDFTRREVENLVAKIRSSQASQKAVKDFHHNLQKREKHLDKLKKQFEPESIEPSVFNIGDSVKILSLNQEGEIDSLIGKDKAKIRVGNVTTTVELRNLQKISKSKDKHQPVITDNILADETLSPEIHLRGMTVEEAIENLEKYLDRAIIAGLRQIYVIHGKGSGVLRRTLTEYLKNHPDVDALRLGNWNEGGAGVTIVKLKE